MDDAFGQKLRDLLADDRIKMLNNLSACENLLRDKTNLTEQEINLLIAVLKSSISSKLKEWVWSKRNNLTARDLESLVHELGQEGFSAEACEWAMRSWATALDIPSKFGIKKKASSGKKQASDSSSSWLSSISSVFGKIKSRPSVRSDSNTPESSSTTGSAQTTAGETERSDSAVRSQEQGMQESEEDSAALENNMEEEGPEPSQSTVSTEDETVKPADAGQSSKESPPAKTPAELEISEPRPNHPDEGQNPQPEESSTVTTVEASEKASSKNDETAIDSGGLKSEDNSTMVDERDQEWWDVLPGNESTGTGLDNGGDAGEKGERSKKPPTPHEDGSSPKNSEWRKPADYWQSQKVILRSLLKGRKKLGWSIATALLLVFSVATWRIIHTDHSPSPDSTITGDEPAQKTSPDHQGRITSPPISTPVTPLAPANNQPATVGPTNRPQPSTPHPNVDSDRLDSTPVPKRTGVDALKSATVKRPEPPLPSPKGNTFKDDKGTNPTISSRLQGEKNLKPDEILADLVASNSTAEFIGKLNMYRNNQLLGFGQRENFGSAEGCYIFIFDKQAIKETYQMKNGNFHSLSNGKEYADITTSLNQNERIVWIQLAH